MDEKLRLAIELRQQQQYEKSDALLTELVQQPELYGKACLQLAWNCDVQGLEHKAIPYYQQALTGELNDTERFDAIFGLASSLRSIGEYQQAQQCFEQAREQFPQRVELLPFYAMNLYNLGRSKQAVELLLSTLIEQTDNADIQSYSAAIKLYAQDLDRVW